ncbi:MAG: hypothetical protein HZA20_13920 [Nitrospirae bacterium]|nr:hypothetical protein [Nitrospirota bacterium]
MTVLLLACSALLPGTSACLYAHDAAPSLSILDVCHASSGGLKMDIPCILCYPDAPVPLQPSSVRICRDTDATPVMLVFRDERPPKSLR